LRLMAKTFVQTLRILEEAPGITQLDLAQKVCVRFLYITAGELPPAAAGGR